MPVDTRSRNVSEGPHPWRIPLVGLLVLSAFRPSLGAETAAETTELLARAYQYKAAGDSEGALAAFEAARAAGADVQRVALEIAYVRLGRGEVSRAREDLDRARTGPDPSLAEQARREIAALPSRLWAELYADSYGWSRTAGGGPGADFVPTVRVRALIRPSLDADVHVYLFGQATRDLASRGRNASALPEIYADNRALAGAGVLARMWRRRLGVFAQAGPAFALVDDGAAQVALDARGGAFLGAETAGCRPRPGGLRLTLRPCAETYAEAVYVSRFDHNVVGFGRWRLAATTLVTGPVAWQLAIETRAAVDRNRNFYNNFADAGVGHRFRLLGRVPLDVLVGVHAGSAFGIASRDPAPRPLHYVDARLQAATYLEF